MDGEGSLQTLAEVSVALAGFASLLVVLRRDPASSWTEGEGADLLIVVGGGLIVVLFALLPLPLLHLGLPQATVWTLSSILLAGVLVAAYAVVFQRRRRLLRAGVQPGFPTLSRFLAQVPLLLVSVLALSAGNLLVPRGVGAYVLVLTLLLASSTFPLVTLVAQLGSDNQR